MSDRPLCADVSDAAGEPVGATASRVEHWLLVEYGGYWPYDPLDATVFAGSLREHLAAQLGALPRSRLFLIKRPGRDRRDRIRVVYGTTPERGGSFAQLELGHHSELAALDLSDGFPGEPLDHPLFLVCTHGIRDRCCARYGQTLCRELHAVAEPGWTWQSSHVGGDRFAGNVVALPEGLYFGRVGKEDVRPLVDAYLEGRIDLERYRGRSAYPFPVQAAELHVRRETGLDGFHDLRLVSARRVEQEAWTVELLAEVAGDVHRVEVRGSLGEPEYLTCKAKEPRRPRVFVARSA